MLSVAFTKWQDQTFTAEVQASFLRILDRWVDMRKWITKNNHAAIRAYKGSAWPFSSQLSLRVISDSYACFGKQSGKPRTCTHELTFLSGQEFYPYEILGMRAMGIADFAQKIETLKLGGYGVKAWSPGAVHRPDEPKVPEVLVVVWAGNDITEKVPKSKNSKAKTRYRSKEVTEDLLTQAERLAYYMAQLRSPIFIGPGYGEEWNITEAEKWNEQGEKVRAKIMQCGVNAFNTELKPPGCQMEDDWHLTDTPEGRVGQAVLINKFATIATVLDFVAKHSQTEDTLTIPEASKQEWWEAANKCMMELWSRKKALFTERLQTLHQSEELRLPCLMTVSKMEAQKAIAIAPWHHPPDGVADSEGNLGGFTASPRGTTGEKIEAAIQRLQAAVASSSRASSSPPLPSVPRPPKEPPPTLRTPKQPSYSPPPSMMPRSRSSPADTRSQQEDISLLPVKAMPKAKPPPLNISPPGQSPRPAQRPPPSQGGSAGASEVPITISAGQVH